MTWNPRKGTNMWLFVFSCYFSLVFVSKFFCNVVIDWKVHIEYYYRDNTSGQNLQFINSSFLPWWRSKRTPVCLSCVICSAYLLVLEATSWLHGYCSWPKSYRYFSPFQPLMTWKALNDPKYIWKWSSSLCNYSLHWILYSDTIFAIKSAPHP